MNSGAKINAARRDVGNARNLQNNCENRTATYLTRGLCYSFVYACIIFIVSLVRPRTKNDKKNEPVSCTACRRDTIVKEDNEQLDSFEATSFYMPVNPTHFGTYV